MEGEEAHKQTLEETVEEPNRKTCKGNHSIKRHLLAPAQLSGKAERPPQSSSHPAWLQRASPPNPTGKASQVELPEKKRFPKRSGTWGAELPERQGEMF